MSISFLKNVCVNVLIFSNKEIFLRMAKIKQIPNPPVYIDPLTDFGSQKIFNTEPNKDLLIHLLNSVFNGRKVITDLTYGKTDYKADIPETGGAIFDLLCTGTDGEKFIIEVQRSNQKNFKDRSVFYTSRLISEQIPKGNRKGWAYLLPEVYMIALLEDFTLEDSPEGEFLHDVCLCNRKTGAIFYDKLGYIYIELRKFDCEEKALSTDLDKWLYVLKNMSKMDKLPVYLRKPVFQKLFTIAEYSNLTKQEKMLYDRSLKYKWDNANALSYAREEGFKKGERKKALAIARELKKRKLSLIDIAIITGLQINEIECL